MAGSELGRTRLTETGGNKGGYWTAFKGTCRNVEAAVRAKPGLTLKELIAGIKHHYATDASARICLADWIEAGKIESVKLVRDGKKITVHPSS